MINHNVSTIMMQLLTNCHYNEIPITKIYAENFALWSACVKLISK